MSASRLSELADGFSLLGFVGWLISAWVIPGQWVAGPVREEALIGFAVSSVCVVLAASIEGRARRIGLVILATLATSTAGYAGVFIATAVETGRTAAARGRLGLLALGLALAAVASLFALSRMRRPRVV